MNIRNVAIIAHVDHGKTTLVDCLLRQSKTHLAKEIADQELIMDSNDLERERGITIFSKNASVIWKDTKINIIDTPGHADFGGEVERVLKMADGSLLLIDAKEGPMPQTRFVLKRALALKHKIIVVINKIDKPDARVQDVLNKTFDLFIELGADDDAADFPVLYSSGKSGVAGLENNLAAMTDITPVFDAILEHVPPPGGDSNAPLQMLVTNITGDSYKGRIAIGRIYNGIIKKGQEIAHIQRDSSIKKYRLTSLMTFEGLDRIDTDEVTTGDILAVSGIPDITIGETIADASNPVALPLLAIEEPTVKMTFMVNDSPFAGREGEFKTSRQIDERLQKELQTDMALRVEKGQGNDWIVSGRGELHLAILIERMRRDGYEFQVSRPQVIDKKVDGVLMTPYEELFVEVPEQFSGVVMQHMGERRGIMEDMVTENGIVFMQFTISTQNLIGLRSDFITDTRGLGIMHSSFYEYRPKTDDIHERTHGSLVAHETGVTALYGLVNVQDRGQLFVGPAVEVYKGQVVGRNSRIEDINVNVCKQKHLSNMRSKGEGVNEHFDTPKQMDLEDALEYISDDELVEVTPKNIRIRKKVLDYRDERRKMLGLIQ